MNELNPSRDQDEVYQSERQQHLKRKFRIKYEND